MEDTLVPVLNFIQTVFLGYLAYRERSAYRDRRDIKRDLDHIQP